MNRAIIAACVAAIPHAVPAAEAPGHHGDHEPDTHHRLEEIRVTADPLDRTTTHIVQPTNVLDRDRLLTRNLRSIGETVADELGVTSSDFGPSVGRPIIRGLSGARVRVLEDGIGTMDVSTISADHAVALEPVFAEQVEIYRGPASLLYGSGASGGFVNVVSGHIPEAVPEAFSGELYGHYDSASDGYLGAVKLAHGLGPVALRFDGLKRDTDDLDIPGFGSVAPDEDARRGTLENSDAQAERGTLGASFVGARGFVGLSVGLADNDYGVPGEAHHHEEEGGGEPEEDEGGVRIEQEQTRLDFKAGLDRPLPGFESLRTRWALNDFEHLEIEGGGEVGTDLQNDELEGRVELVHAPLAGFDGAVGVQLRDRDLETAGEEAFVPDSELTSVGVFLLERRDVGAWHVELGARYEHQSAESGALDVTHDLYNGSLGARWAFHADHHLGFAWTHAQRAPAIEELFANGAHLATNTFEIGDPGLDEETSNNVDVSLARTSGRWTWTVNAFYNRIDDFVFLRENDLNGDGIADRVEPDFDGDPANVVDADETDELLLVNHAQADAEFWGFEAESVLDIFDDARGHLDVRVWGDYVRARLLDGGDLPRIPPLRFGASVSWDRRGWTAGMDYTRVERQDSTAALETSTSGYHMLNLDLGYKQAYAGTEWTAFLRASNLLDEEARRHVSFLKNQAPLPGRAVLLAVRVRL